MQGCCLLCKVGGGGGGGCCLRHNLELALVRGGGYSNQDPKKKEIPSPALKSPKTRDLPATCNICTAFGDGQKQIGWEEPSGPKGQGGFPLSPSTKEPGNGKLQLCGGESQPIVVGLRIQQHLVLHHVCFFCLGCRHPSCKPQRTSQSSNPPVVNACSCTQCIFLYRLFRTCLCPFSRSYPQNSVLIFHPVIPVSLLPLVPHLAPATCRLGVPCSSLAPLLPASRALSLFSSVALFACSVLPPCPISVNVCLFVYCDVFPCHFAH